MSLGTYIRHRFEGTRFEPVVEGVRRMRWPRVWRVGEKDHKAMMTILPMLLRRNSVCVDIGANKGEILEIILRLCPNARHHAVEPLPHMAQGLRDKFPNVTIHELALSDQNGEAVFHHVLDDDAYSGLKPTDYGNHKNSQVQKIPVKLRRLDEVIPADVNVEFIKIDVEGAELQVLKGAEGLLRRSKPTIIFEFQQERAPSYGTTPDLMFDLLVDQIGYSLFTIDGIGPLTRAQFNEVFKLGSTYNFVARNY